LIRPASGDARNQPASSPYIPREARAVRAARQHPALLRLRSFTYHSPSCTLRSSIVPGSAYAPSDTLFLSHYPIAVKLEPFGGIALAYCCIVGICAKYETRLVPHWLRGGPGYTGFALATRSA